MINDEMVEAARKNFLTAAKKFGFVFVSPYCLDADRGLEAFGYMPEYGSEKGAVILLAAPPDYEINPEIKLFCKQKDIWFSVLCVQHLTGEYNPDYFSDILDDWKIG